MDHQAAVLGVEVGAGGEVVFEVVAGFEHGEEAGEAGVAGVAAAVDDFGAGEEEGDEAEVEEVQGHFIDDVQGGGVERLESIEIFAAEGVGLLGGQMIEAGRVLVVGAV